MVVIAALLVSSALMMRVPSRFSILGYPGLAVMGYLAAAVAARVAAKLGPRGAAAPVAALEVEPC